MLALALVAQPSLALLLPPAAEPARAATNGRLLAWPLERLPDELLHTN
jgi:hypothetical protein